MSENIYDALFSKFEKLNVLIVGDVMIDRYLKGKVSRISPEAPVPIVELKSTEDRLGGAANVALNIKALGATPYLCTVVGKDDESAHFLKLMNAHNLPTRGIVSSKERTTTLKTRVVVGSQQMLRLDTENTDDLEAKATQLLLEKIDELLEQKQIDVVIIQDYNKGVLSLNLIKEMMLRAIRLDIPTAIDPKKNNFFEFKGATLFKPNLKEIREALPFDIEPTTYDLDKAAEYLRQRLGHKHTLITLSERGLYWENPDFPGQIFPTKPRNIADVSGAGDTVISIAALGLALRLDIETVVLLSNLAGGQVCEEAGVVPVSKSKLLAELVKNN
jgi:D-glycero-beta-D-manno-heptose-7-phosphate kinase